MKDTGKCERGRHSLSQIRLQTAEKQDCRIRLMREIITSMKLIKMHCWENSFAEKIAHARRSEMGLLRLL